MPSWGDYAARTNMKSKAIFFFFFVVRIRRTNRQISSERGRSYTSQEAAHAALLPGSPLTWLISTESLTAKLKLKCLIVSHVSIIARTSWAYAPSVCVVLQRPLKRPCMKDLRGNWMIFTISPTTKNGKIEYFFNTLHESFLAWWNSSGLDFNC